MHPLIILTAATISRVLDPIDRAAGRLLVAIASALGVLPQVDHLSPHDVAEQLGPTAPGGH